MQPFVQHRGLLAPLNRANVDTDQIIPKQFLQSIRKTGFENGLFFDRRFTDQQTPNPSFSLNKPRYKGASLLVTRNNFGCGSSREHAVWAILQYGFRAILAPRVERDGVRVPAFADIFRNNAVTNGLLTVELTEKEIDEIFSALEKHPGLEATVDLEAKQVILHSPQPKTYRFDIEEGARRNLLKGLDEIQTTLQWEKEIVAFEAHHDLFLPPAPPLETHPKEKRG